MFIAKIIMIISGKGGVGKSTITWSLARGLVAAGKRCGVVDADISGPNLPSIAKSTTKSLDVIQQEDKKLIVPEVIDGIKLVSMAYFTDNAIAWRGPMVSGALLQLVNKTQWGELDYVLIDMPPGTGDIHLTAAQKLNIDSAIMITNASVLSQEELQRSVKFCKKLKIPILGYVENMSSITCPHCDKEHDLFSSKEGTMQDIGSCIHKIPFHVHAQVPSDTCNKLAENFQLTMKNLEKNTDQIQVKQYV